MIEAVLFDIDGTLLDHDRASERSLRQALDRERPGLSEDHHRAALVEWRRLEEVHYAAYLGGEIELVEQRRRRAAGILGWLGAADRPPDGHGAWFEDFLAGYRSHWAAFDDVEPVIAEFEQCGLAMGAITNADEAIQRRKLAALGLDRALSMVVASSSAGAAKPEARIFEIACEGVALEPDRVAYVGDRVDTDARGARDAGLLGIWLNREGGEVADDVPTVGSLAEIPALIERRSR
jgi:putative hydrolase of the HAD superfamily